MEFGEIKKCLAQIIDAVTLLHQHGIIHGNLIPSQIGYFGGECKVRVSLTHPLSEINNFLIDIHAIALLGYQMAFGMIENNEGIFHNRKVVLDTLRGKNANSTEEAQLLDLLGYLLMQ